RPQRLRWLDLLSYLVALVYHERPENEHEPLGDLIEKSVKKDEYRQEVHMARRTIAQMLRDEGRAEARREHAAGTRLLQLRLRFGELPAAVEQTVQATRDVEQLERWLDRFATAKSLSEVGIPTQP